MRVSLLLACGLLCLLHHSNAQIMSVDLGHEFFKVALMRQGVPLEIVLNSHSKRKTPTAASFYEAIRAFGDDAIGHSSKAPTKVPIFFHHLLNRNFTSAADVGPDGVWWKAFGLSSSFYTFNLQYDEQRGVPAFLLGSENSTSLEEVLANILYFARTMAEESADGKNVRDLVVTVPSDASMRYRQAIIAAGEIAGCRVLTLVHEGSAFAVQRAVDFQPEKGNTDIVLFYNLGSRKAEATIVKYESRQAGMVAGKTAPVVTVLGSAIDFGMGGHLFDLKIAESMLKKFQEKHPKLADGIVKNPRALRKLLSQAQKTKAILSANKAAPFIVESLYEDTDFQTTIKREEFEEMCKDMFDTLTAPIEKAMAVANITAADLTQIEVVGGAWRVPKIQTILSEYVEKKKEKKLPLGQHLNGEEGAAQGSLLVGANSSSSFRVKKIFFTDITMHEYAVQVASLTGEWEKNRTTLYPTGSALGAKKKLSFALEEDFEIRLFEDGILLSTYAVSGLADALKGKWSEYNLTGTPKITVSVPLESSGIIEVKDPKATVEEVYWVNVTKEKAKPGSNTSEANTTANASESPTNGTEEAPKEEATPTDDANTSGEEANTTGNGSNETIEYEVIQKKKTKKHEKKLTVIRFDYKPKPLTEEQIAETKKKLEAQSVKEEEVAKVTALKNELEAAIYSSREKLERDDIVQVSQEAQREELMKLCTEYEEWMYEGSAEKTDYERKLSSLRDLLGPMEERAQELEARADLPDAVKEQVRDCKDMQAQIAKNMSWISENKTADAAKKLAEFEEWWSKKQDSQAKLPLYEAPAFTRAEVIERIQKVWKEFDKLKKIKKPKEKKPKAEKNATSGDKKASATKAEKEEKKEEPLPDTAEATEKELTALREKKAEAVEKEDYDTAQSLKTREKALAEHLSRLMAQKTDL